MCVYMPPPRTATGEAMVELHVHGGVAIVDATLDALGTLIGTHRAARPGEFTRRCVPTSVRRTDACVCTGRLLTINCHCQLWKHWAIW
jgi:tRNA modification GTPase